MKFRFLLFLILVFFIGSFSLKAQDLKYNGKVKIEIKITQFLQKDMTDSKRDLDCKARLYKHNKTDYYEWNSDLISGNGEEKAEDYEPWYNLNRTLPINFYSQDFTVENDQTLHDYFSDENNNVLFRFKAWEHDGGSNDDDDIEECDFSILDLVKNDNAPGYHQMRLISDANHHWAFDIEYSITPPAPTIDKIIQKITEEESELVISSRDLGGNIKYEWFMNIDGKVSIDYVPTGQIDWNKYNECIAGCDDSGQAQRTESLVTRRPDIPIGGGTCDEQCMSEAKIYEEVEELVWEYPIDKTSRNNKTDHSTLTYDIPEFDGFHKNYKFIAYSYVETTGKNTLESVDFAEIAIVDVFPSFPKIQPFKNEDIKIVTCAGGNDGEVNLKVSGDLGNGVDEYRILVIKDKVGLVKGPFNVKLESDDVLGDPKEIRIDELQAGDYEIIVNNSFLSNTVDTTEFFENHDGVQKRMLIGHDTISFTINENKLITLDGKANFKSNGNCNQYVVDLNSVKAQGGLGGYKYSLDNTNIGTSPRLLAANHEVPNEGASGEIQLYIEDREGCIGEGKAILNRDEKFEFIVPDENLPVIKCYGGTTSFEVLAQGGSGSYQFELDKSINASSASSTKSLNFEVDAGEHTFYAKDSHGCSSNTKRTFLQKDPIEIYDFVKTEKIKGKEIHVSCNGYDNGEIKFKIRGGTPPYSYTLNGPTPKSETISSDHVEVAVYGLLAGSYVLTITDAKNCGLLLDKKFDLIEPSKVQVNPTYADYSGFNYKCFGDFETIDLKVSGGLAPYSLQYGSVVKSISDSGGKTEFDVQGTKPVITITDDLGCKPKFDLKLKEPNQLTVGFEFNTYQAGPDGGMGQVYHIQKNGGTDKLDVIVEGGITPYTINLKKYENGTWKTVEERTSNLRENRFNVTAGTYKAFVNGKYPSCVTDNGITLQEPDQLLTSITYPDDFNGYRIECNGDVLGRFKAMPTGGIKPYTLVITKPDGSQSSRTLNSSVETTFDNLGSGTYNLKVKDKFENSILKENIVLNEPEELSLNLSTTTYQGGFQIKCSDLLGYVDAVPEGGAGTTYDLLQMCKNKTDVRKEKTGATRFDNLDEGYYTYRLTDINGCFIEESIDISKPEELTINFGAISTPSCHKDDMGDNSLKEDGEIKVNATGGCDALNYTFSLQNHTDGSVTNLSGKTMDFKGLKTGTYDIKVTDANGCEVVKKEQNLGQPNLLRIDEISMEVTEPTCFDYNDGHWESNILGGTTIDGQYTYKISKGTESNTGKVGSSFNQSDLAAGNYKVEITDDKGCYFTMEKELKQPDFIVNQLHILGIDILNEGGVANFDCFGDDGGSTITVNGGTANYTVQINKGGLLYQELNEVAENTPIEAKNLDAGNYSILTTDIRGCRSDKIDFILNQPEEIEFNRDAAKYTDDKTGEFFDYTCFGDTETIGVSVKGGHAPYQITYNGETKEISESEGFVDFDISGTKPVFDIIDAKGCDKKYTPILKEPAELLLELSIKNYVSDKGEDYNIKCFGGTDTIWANASGGITPYTYSLFDGSNNQIAEKESNEKVFFDALPVGSYTVKVKGAYNEGCFTTNTISLKQPDPVDSKVELSNFEGFEVRCNGLSDSVKVEALGGISPYKLKLTGIGIDQEFINVSDEIQTFKDLPAGMYQLSITDKFEACEYKKDIILTEPTAINFDIETSHYHGDFEIRCSYLKDSVRIVPTGGIPVTNSSKYRIEQIDEDDNRQLGNIIAGENLVFKNLGAGMYSYKVSDDNGCFIGNVVELRKPDSLQIADIDFTIPTCHEKDMGDISKRTDGEITVQVTGGVSFADGYDFLLNKMPISEAKDRLDSIRGANSVIFESLETGEYIIEVRDVNTCISKLDKQHLLQPDWLHIEKFNPVIPECYEAKDGFWESEIIGGTSTSGNYSYVLSKNEDAFRSGSTGTEWNQDQLGKGKYLIEITDDLGCYYKQEEDMLQPDEISIDFDVMGVTDFGNNDGAARARISGGNGEYRYQWYHKGEKILNGEQEKIENLYAGEYTVEVWDKNNCPYGNNEFGIANGLKKTVSVVEPGSKLSIVANPVKTSYYGAEDGVLQVSAVGGWPYAVWPGYEFSLNHGEWKLTSQFENLKAGLYHLKVRDTKGVLDSIEVEIEEPEEIFIQLEKKNCLCKNDSSGSIIVSASGGTAPYTYALNYAIDFNRSNEFTGLKAGNYRIFVKDKLGNIQNKYVDLEEPEVLAVEMISLEHSTCNSSNGSVQIKITGGTPDYYINWGDFFPNDELYPNNLNARNYHVEVTDANSCTSSKSFVIQEKSGPEINLMELKEVSCHEATDGEIYIDIKNGTAPYDLVWKGLESINSSSVKQLGKGKYSVAVSDANNCFDEAEYEITGPEELELYISSLQSPNCVGINDGSILMTAVGGSPEYLYTLNGESNDQGWFTNLGAGEMKLEVADKHGCTKELESELTAPVPVTINLPNEYVLCKNQSELISSGIENAISEWFYNDVPFSNEEEVEVFNEGNYILKLTTDKGCKAEHEFNVSFLDYEVAADFIIPVEAIVGDTIVAVDISWELPDSVKWILPDEIEVIKKQDASIWMRILQAGNHTVGMSIYKNECSDYVEKQVNVKNSSTKRKAGFIQPEEAYITEAKLYPNPNRGDFYLKILLNRAEDVRIEIYNVQRAVKIDSREGKKSAVYQFNFNDKSLFRPNNIYMLVIRAGNEKKGLRFVVY